MRIVMTDCQETILREIATPSLKQLDVAQSYALTMESGEQVDWAKINKAIMDRWSKSGLIRIKEMAHRGTCWKG